jgi:hypothetical protein
VIPYKITKFERRKEGEFTTRKPEKTNGITNENILSVIITDGNNSVSTSVGIYRPFCRRGIQFVWKYTMAW